LKREKKINPPPAFLGPSHTWEERNRERPPPHVPESKITHLHGTCKYFCGVWLGA
jgi:hypothetical protein